MKTNQVVIIGNICLGLLACALSGNAQLLDGTGAPITGTTVTPVDLPTGTVNFNGTTTIGTLQSGLTANGLIQTFPGGAKLDRNAVFAAIGNIDTLNVTTANITGTANLGDINATTVTASGQVQGGSLTDGRATLASGNLTGANNILATGTIQGRTISDGVGTTISGGTVNANTVNSAWIADGAGTTITGGTVQANTLTDGTTSLSGGKLSVIRAGQTITVIDTVSGNITTINAETGNINTINAVSGNIQTVNVNQVNVRDGIDVGAGAATITSAGVITGARVVTPRLTLGGTDVYGIQTAAGQAGKELAAFTSSDEMLATSAYAKQAAMQATVEANSYARGRYQKLNRGIAMTAALQTPTIEPGKNNALKVSAAGYEGDAGLSIGYARRISEGWSVDISAATSAEWKEGVVRGGINWSF